MTDEKQLHWLVRPTTIRRLWIGSSIVLAITVALQLAYPFKGYFSVDGWMGFGAVYGFLSCVSMVLFAKLLGVVLKRPDSYYDSPEDEESNHAD